MFIINTVMNLFLCTYIITHLYYTTQIVTDYLSACTLTVCLLLLVRTVPVRLGAAINLGIMLVDLIIKVPVLNIGWSRYVDDSCVVELWMLKPTWRVMVYFVCQVWNVYVCLCAPREVRGKKWGPLITQIMLYVTPICIYALAMMCERYLQTVAWSLLAYAHLLSIPHAVLTTIPLVVLISVDVLFPSTYRLSHLEEASYVELALKLIILLMLNVGNNPYGERQSVERLGKRQLQQERDWERMTVVLIIVFTVAVCLITNSPANILLVFAIYFSLPHYRPTVFWMLVVAGLGISIALQPYQLPYILYAYIIHLLLPLPSNPITYSCHSYKMLVSVYGLYLLFNHVSFLNFLMGMMRYAGTVVLVLTTRIACRYGGVVDAFLGTNDNYGFEGWFIDGEALSDGVLWVYLILLSLYSPQASTKYSHSQITNILLEYPIINRYSSILTPLRMSNWLSYTILSLAILNHQPSIYILLQALLLLLLIMGQLYITDPPNKSMMLRWCWVACLYITTCMVFIKYFYLLKQYHNTSQIVIYVLEFLTKYQSIIGLGEVSGQSGGIELLHTFVYDGCVMMMCWVNMYVLDIKLYEAYREIVIDNQQIGAALLPDERTQAHSIHYFYQHFIKPINFKHLLNHEKLSTLCTLCRYCVTDVYVLLIMGGYAGSSGYGIWLYFPQCLFSVYYYHSRKLRSVEVMKRYFSVSTVWWLCSIIWIYGYNIKQELQDSHTLTSIWLPYIYSMVGYVLYHVLDNIPQQEQGHSIIYSCLPKFGKESCELYTRVLECLGVGSSLVCLLDVRGWLFWVNLCGILALYVLYVRWGDRLVFVLMRELLLLNVVFDNFWVCVPFIFITCIFHLPEKDMQQPQHPHPLHSFYCSMLALLPVWVALIMLFGVVWLSPSLFTLITLTILWFQLMILICSPKLPQQIISLAKFLFFCSAFLIVLCSCLGEVSWLSLMLVDDIKFGMFFVLLGCLVEMRIMNRKWYYSRKQEAIVYWELKSELIAELGSQLHNEKKLMVLQSHYDEKEKLSRKIDIISENLKQGHKQNIIDSLERLSIPNEEKENYELYSNMLIFLSYKSLLLCFNLLNQYVREDAVPSLWEQSRNIKTSIKNIYQHSFEKAFKQLEAKDEGQLHLSNDDMEESKVTIEKIYEVSSKYNKCFRIIHQESMNFNLILRLCIQNVEILGLMMVVGWNFWGGVYIIPINLAVFGWAVVLENKTTTFFWTFVMSYALLILLLKQVYGIFPTHDVFTFLFYFHSTDYLYEYAVVFISILQIIVIKLGGTETKSYSERESIYDACYRGALNRASSGIKHLKEEQFMEIYKNLSQPDKHSFFYRVFSKSRFKAGKDFYPLMSTVQLIILLYIFFFYDMMEFESRKNRRSIGELLTMTSFSSHMIIALLTQIVIMVIDRFLVSLNIRDKHNEALQNFFLSFIFKLNDTKHQPPQKLQHFGIFDFLLIIKYIFHFLLLVLVNFLIYIYIPSGNMNKTLIPNCTTLECSKKYIYLTIFTFLYLLYFLLSGLQIKYGFNRNKCRNVLMQKYHYINYYLYRVFTGIPFAWEFKKISDWTVTATSLRLFHWLKFQDINARLYQSKCESEMLMNKDVGMPWNKYLLGPSGCLFILMLVFSPFIMYSPINPFVVKDIVVGARSEVLLRVDGRLDYRFFQTSHASIEEKLSGDIFSSEQNDMDLWRVQMSRFPDENFLLSEPTVASLSKKIRQTYEGTLQHRFQLVLEIGVIEKEGGESTIQWVQKTLNTAQLRSLYQMLQLEIQSLSINQFYAPYPGKIPPVQITLYTPNKGQSFHLSTQKQGKSEAGIYFYYLTSHKFRIGLGVVAFYLTYVLLVSRLLKFYLSVGVQSIIHEGWHMERMLVLCEGVRSARMMEDFHKEEFFFYELIDLMRQPQILKNISGDFLTLRKQHF